MLKIKCGDCFWHHLTSVPENTFHRHMHNEFELLYFLSGDAEYIIEGSVYRLRPRDLLLIRPRTFHYLKPLSAAPYERFVINIPEGEIPPLLRDFAQSTENIFRLPEHHPAARLFEDWIEIEARGSAEELTLFLSSFVKSTLLYLKLLPITAPVTPLRANRTFDAVLRYIDEHPEERVTAATLAARFFISTSSIVHTCRHTLGISLMQYVSKKRILYAQSRIRSGISPTEVAKLCHYESYATFYRQYKKILNRSPHEDAVK